MTIALFFLAALSAGEWIAIFAIVIPVLIAFGVLIFKTGCTYTKVGDLGESVEELENNVGNLSTVVNRIDRRTNSIITYLVSRDSSITLNIFGTDSPIVLTEFGYEILKVSGAEDFVNSKLDYLINLMETENYKSALDIQNGASAILSDESSSDSFIEIKNFIFNNPVYKDSEINLTVMIRIMGIYLRDKYFEKHPELKNIEPTDEKKNN